ncbi:sugar phosphate isomerase/epimerase [Burkholderia multivorans]|uniref:sugar phosphate isomerase/epimerase n=1 Tax=Burkholderia multivorans TaxID=87883 RepID=UPI002019C5F9|nr:sugar phosphate isomerase/epimerase [Burkholderia multivorans]MCO1368646.1 sugar phosphate isomerase/epimerase [Burkholderia multivorans]MCO1380537.1 sugar phosphate isomerase/epimerase [Burkholderia multivorans]MDN8032398.1 sugar phosphate isomerase/epimerase [Burkholderia multivorans]UQP22036.1 sugar phosphate isomerase/epimerase [Burkholderia multivorans]UQP91516.1 sugar phosphate isomerase/epimerase [Burkholderia multivorans]
MTIKRGVSLYSYQQSQFFKELDLEAQIREVGENLNGVDGIEIIDEMSLRYPNPGDAFTKQWFAWMEKYGTTPVTMDVGMDVLQFRDHVMTYEECADRLRHDIRLAKSLGFKNVRVLSVVPIEILISALPLAESLDIRLGKEIHQPMRLEGQQVTEILDYVAKTGTKHLGIVPDLGIFQTRPSEALLGWFERKGAQRAACDASVELANKIASGEASFSAADLPNHTAGNVRSAFTRFLKTGERAEDFAAAFDGVKQFADERVDNPQELDYTVVAEALMLSRTSADTLRQIAGNLVGVHGKFYNMSPVPGKEGQFQDIAIDYESAISALKDGGFDGYINSEYEGQRYYQDRGREDMMSEVEQVRRHQEMLGRLLSQ